MQKSEKCDRYRMKCGTWDGYLMFLKLETLREGEKIFSIDQIMEGIPPNLRGKLLRSTLLSLLPLLF